MQNDEHWTLFTPKWVYQLERERGCFQVCTFMKHDFSHAPFGNAKFIP